MIIEFMQRDKLHQTKVIFDNGEECLLDNDICSENGLKVGIQISLEELNSLKYSSDYARAKSRALWYLDRSDHTEKALFQKLVRAGFDKKASAAVIARFIEIGLIDDRRYAENYAEKCCEANISRREAVRKMLEKGVPYEMASEILDGIDTDEEAQITAVIKKKYERKLSSENGTQKVYAALIRKGFSYGAVRNALKNYCQELEFYEE